MAGLSIDHALIAFLTAIGFALIALGGRATAARKLVPGIVGVGAGAALLVALAFRIFPALLNTETRVEREALQQTIAKVQAELSAVKAERDQALARATTAAIERKAIEGQTADALSRISKEIGETYAHFGDAPSPLKLTRPHSTSPASLESIVADLKALRAPQAPRTEVAAQQAPAPQAPVAAPAPVQEAPPAAQTKPAPPAIQPATPPAAPTPVVNEPTTPAAPPPPQVALQPAPKPPQAATTVERLREQLAQRFDAKAYRIAPLPDPELVVGQRGTYYTIDIKNLETDAEFRFDSARYTLNNGTTDFRRALAVFMSEIVSPIEGKAPYQLYVRGAADRLGYKGKFEPGFEYREVQYLKSAAGNRYAAEPQLGKFEDVVRNRDLPNLRGMYLQALIGEAHPKAVPDVLEGIISSKREISRRNLELILFVGW